MKNKFGIINLIFFIVILGLIVAGYFLLLKDIQEEKLFYLNMIATCVVASMIYVRSSDIFDSVGKVASRSAGYGLKWTGLWIYVVLALALIVLSIVLRWEFTLCLLIHIALIIIVLGYFFLGSTASDNANRVIAETEERKSVLRQISNQINMLEARCKMGSGSEYLDTIATIRENVRFITASEKPEAAETEKKLLTELILITDQIGNASQSSDTINSELKDCLSLIEIRKRQY